MTIQVSYTQARAELAKLLDEVSQDRKIVIIRRRNADDVALIAADELTSIMETIHLLRSPANAERLLGALKDSLEGKGEPMAVDELKREVGLDRET
jgi:antitoxin YefM